MTTEQTSALENLEYIKRIMTDTRKTLNNNGIISIVWGILVAMGQIGNYLLTVNKIWNGYWILWLVLGIIGWIFVIIEKKSEKKHSTKTFAGKILGSLWFSAGISMTIIGYGAAASGMVGGYAINPLIATTMGGAYYVTSFLVGKKLDRILSFGWWIGALVMFMIPGNFTFLLFAGMMIFFQVIPGVISYRSYKASRGV